MSFYLKYRPQKANDLDLTQVREFFERILKSGKVAHAYLFTGPRGTGKTSAARILAKIINCHQNSGVRGKGTKRFQEPCNKCVACKSVTDGSMVDLIEIDAASNRGIDDIRDLREKIGLTPVGATKKVYIIDEVHMLTIEAFNALLKTLEEPPDHAVFVLATTEAHKVPETIKSRCVRLQFPKAKASEVVRSLKKVVKGEKLPVSDGVLEEVAGGVDGSFREGMKILEQLSLGKGKITLAKARVELGVAKEVEPEKFLEALANRDLADTISEIDRLEGLGVNWKVFVVKVFDQLRFALLEIYDVNTGTQKGLKFLLDLGGDELLSLIDKFAVAARQMGSSAIEQLPLEILAIEWCGTNAKSKMENLPRPPIRRVNRQAGGKFPDEKLTEKVGLPNNQKPVNSSQESVTSNQTSGSSNQKVENRIQGTEKQKGKAVSSHKKSVMVPEEMDRCWSEVLTLVRPHNHSVEGLLRSTKPIGVSGKNLKVEVFYKFHLDQLNQEKFLQIVEGAVEKAFAASLRLEYFLGSRPQRKEVEVVENIAGGVEDEDIIQVAEEVFGAE